MPADYRFDTTLEREHTMRLENFNKAATRRADIATRIAEINAELANLKFLDETAYVQEFRLESERAKLQEAQEQILNEDDYYIAVADILFENATKKENKTQLLDEYLFKIDPNHTLKVRRNKLYECESCGAETHSNKTDGSMICKKCGHTEYDLAENMQSSFGDTQQANEAANYTYKKIMHLNEWLEQIQGKERTKIPPEVLSALRTKIQDMGLDVRKVNYSTVKKIMKLLNLTGYNEHVPYILFCLGGRKPPEIPPRIEITLKRLFSYIEIAFKYVKPASRKNFMYYGAAISQALKLIGGAEHLLRYFPNLKSETRRKTIDKFWKDICEVLNFQYIQVNTK